MKLHQPQSKLFAGLAALALTFVGAVSTANAASTALNGQVVLRPLTPGEITTYGLTNAQFSAGLTTVAIGEPVYLDAIVTAVIAPSNIVGVTWSAHQHADGGEPDQQSAWRQCAALQNGRPL